MKDTTNRRLLIIIGLSVLLTVGAITIGIMGIVNILNSEFVSNFRNLIQPIVTIRSDAPPPEIASIPDTGPSAIDIETNRMATQQAEFLDIYSGWPALLDEPFEVNDFGWPIFENQDELADLSVEITGGRYQWQALANDGFTWWAYPDMDPLTDFYAELVASQPEGDPYGEIGLVFRLVDDEFYLFEVSGEYYGFWRSEPGGWVEIIEWTAIDAIYPGAPNKLGVLAIADHFYLFINDQIIGEVVDDFLKQGVIGVAIGLEEAGDKGLFEFDDLHIRAP